MSTSSAPSDPVETATPGFRRVVSRWEIVAFSINDVIGSGVYLLPAAAAAILGAASVGAVVFAGFAVLLVLCSPRREPLRTAGRRLPLHPPRLRRADRVRGGVDDLDRPLASVASLSVVVLPRR